MLRRPVRTRRPHQLLVLLCAPTPVSVPMSSPAALSPCPIHSQQVYSCRGTELLQLSCSRIRPDYYTAVCIDLSRSHVSECIYFVGGAGPDDAVGFCSGRCCTGASNVCVSDYDYAVNEACCACSSACRLKRIPSTRSQGPVGGIYACHRPLALSLARMRLSPSTR